MAQTAFDPHLDRVPPTLAKLYDRRDGLLAAIDRLMEEEQTNPDILMAAVEAAFTVSDCIAFLESRLSGHA
jgi:hypothetical protein